MHLRQKRNEFNTILMLHTVLQLRQRKNRETRAHSDVIFIPPTP